MNQQSVIKMFCKYLKERRNQRIKEMRNLKLLGEVVSIHSTFGFTIIFIE